jgi:hypothetical protein
MAGWRDPDDYDDYDDYDEADWRLRPHWLHPDCLDPCTALNLGTCCKYPADALVARAVHLADSASETLRRIGGQGGGGGEAGADCARPSSELARLFTSLPGLLAQVHAVLPGVRDQVAAQLLCPIGRLSGSLEQACSAGCPWACGDPAVPTRRAEFESLLPLLEECAAALWVSLRDQPPEHG